MWAYQRHPVRIPLLKAAPEDKSDRNGKKHISWTTWDRKNFKSERGPIASQGLFIVN